MLRFERPAPGRLAAALAETGDCRPDGDLPSPLAVALEDEFGECVAFRVLPGLAWPSAVEGALRPDWGEDGFFVVADMVIIFQTAPSLHVEIQSARSSKDF